MLDPEFLKQFLYLAVGVILLMRKGVSDKQFNFTVYLFSAVYFLLFYGQYINIFTMAGDNICQIAYWKILFHPNLTGSIGAAYTKPGQLLILGTLFELSTIFGENAFRIGLCLIMAACVWSLVRIATDIGGREAGFLAFLVSTYAFRQEFLAGSYSIFLIPTMYLGIRLYFYHPNGKTLGRLFLVSTIQFHIQAIAVLAVIWLILVYGRNWRELGRFTMSGIASFALWLILILRIQGAFDRLDSGAAVGYVSHQFGTPGDSILNASLAALSGSPSLTVLLILAIIGAFKAHYLNCRAYLVVFASLFPVMIYVVLVSHGGFNLGRFAALVYAFGCTVGIGAIVKLIDNKIPAILANNKIKYIKAVCIILIFSAVLQNKPFRSQIQPYVESSFSLLNDKALPHRLNVLTEDDILYPLVVMAHERCNSLSSLQHFNVANKSMRNNILSKTDYIWVATNGLHTYYYLNYLSEPAWRSDPFRLMITAIIHTSQAGTLYGYRFIPVDRNRERLLLKVIPENPT